MFVSNRFFGALKIAATSSALSALVACSSNSPNTGSTGNNANNGNSACTGAPLSLSFAPNMYSAFDGTHTFQIPAVVNGASGAAVQWSVSSNNVTFQTDNDTGGIMLTVNGATPATVTVHAQVNTQAGLLCGDSTLNITAAPESEWETGNARYNNSNPLPNLGAADGGLPNISPAQLMSGMNFLDPANAPPACTNCHGPTATSGYLRDVSHTPQQTGGFSDDELKAIFTQGQVPAGGYFDSTVITMFAWSFFHKWSDMTPDQAQGMVIYLRSLTPAPQNGMLDFGGAGAGN